MPVTTGVYDRTKAVQYAHAWALSRNPAYYDYEKLGGDCTNFVSQCLLAGSGVMDYSQNTGWYYINANTKSPSWTGVMFLKEFLVRRSVSPGPFAREASLRELLPGDIVQLSFDGKNFQHSLLIIDTGNGTSASELLVAAHTDDIYRMPLSGFAYSRVRFLHITAVRKRT